VAEVWIDRAIDAIMASRSEVRLYPLVGTLTMRDPESSDSPGSTNGMPPISACPVSLHCVEVVVCVTGGQSDSRALETDV